MEKSRRDPLPPLHVLKQLHEKPALITTAEEAPIANGRLVVREAADGDGTAQVNLEFVVRTVTFVLPIPAAQLFRLAGTWNGSHFVYALPPGEQLWLQPPGDERD